MGLGPPVAGLGVLESLLQVSEVVLSGSDRARWGGGGGRGVTGGGDDVMMTAGDAGTEVSDLSVFVTTVALAAALVVAPIVTEALITGRGAM